MAKCAGLANSTIRLWTKEGLLDVAETTPSGYQLYAADALKRIEEIQALEGKRHTLEEIRDMLREQ